jgi:GTP-binding protein EngB required for normal cell division
MTPYGITRLERVKEMFRFSVIPGRTIQMNIILIENNKYSHRAFSIKFVAHPFFSHMKLPQFVTGSFLKWCRLYIHKTEEIFQFNAGCVLVQFCCNIQIAVINCHVSCVFIQTV